MADNVHELARALRGLDYPAPRNKLIATALENGASREVIDRLHELSETADFRNAEQLQSALGILVPGSQPRGWQ
jgi:Protein of unknown function (DUF2795)